MQYFGTTFSDDKLEAIAEKIADAGVTGDDFSGTRETIDDFLVASKNWSQCGEIDEQTIDGTRAVLFRNAQSAKGQQRKNVLVVDCGDFRAICTAL